MKSNTKTNIIALFDLDGVLIKPGGYRAAVNATINYFRNLMGIGEQAPFEADIALLEANGVTSEWDIVPICLAILLQQISETLDEGLPDCGLADLWRIISEIKPEMKNEYRPQILEVVKTLIPGIPPAESLLTAIQRKDIFEGLADKAFTEDLLGNTRSITRSNTLRIFQNFILGDRRFVETYAIQPEFKAESYLLDYDRRLLNAANENFLRKLIKDENLKIAVITARPSLPPESSNAPVNDYSPEAEMALDLAGLDEAPVVGYGSIQFLAAEMGVSPESLVKPSPIQALAAIYAAVSKNVHKSLVWAQKFAQKDPAVYQERTLPSRMEIHIFEDSPIGIQACCRAAILLEAAGYKVTVKAWGIAKNEDKIKALEAAGARVYPDVNQVIRLALGW